MIEVWVDYHFKFSYVTTNSIINSQFQHSHIKELIRNVSPEDQYSLKADPDRSNVEHEKRV